MADALDAGKTMAEGILAKLPESLRAAFQAIVGAPEAADALKELGSRTLAQSDYSRQLDAIREKETALTTDYENLNAWYTTNKATLERAAALEAEVARLKGNGTPPPKPPEKPAPTPGFDPKALDENLSARERAAALYLNAVSKLGLEHYVKFNEVLDANELMALAEAKHMSILDAYQAKYGEKLAAKAKEAEDARVNKIVEERLAEERKKNPQLPYPTRQAPSVLDVLETKDGSAAHTLDTAVAEFERLQAARG